ncbi:MAG TPA: prephenate dehydrogenase/arogenate dehydrogenase family protein [Candidatus Bathyarchaeia archaeon]|nr:prephenate dehydrogenase/arogenate dehydrogenase family protein [Candidatus Bathyarchaeia archaeon]
MRITILGGAGGMGEWFARFFKENTCDVQIVDVSDKTAAVAKELGVQFSTADILKIESEALKKAFVDTDVVLVSVPIAVTERVIERVGPTLQEGSLLMDVTSVKKAPVEMMEKCTTTGVEILGTHPLFGPSAKSLHGMPVIFVPIRKGPLYEKMYGMFERNGAKIEFLTAEEHDEIMAVIQGLPHFILFSYGITLKDLDFDVEQARRFMGPMYAVVMDFVGRLLHQDPHLYAQIQTNFEMSTIQEAFLAAATRLSELVSEGNVDAIMGEMQLAKQHFGDTEGAMRNSDRIIDEKINLSLKKNVRSKKTF